MADVDVKTEDDALQAPSVKSKDIKKYSIIDNLDDAVFIKGTGKSGYPYGIIVLKFENGGEFSSFLKGNDMLVVESLTVGKKELVK